MALPNKMKFGIALGLLGAAVYEATFLWVSILLAVIAVCCILIGACPNTSKWVDNNRVV